MLTTWSCGLMTTCKDLVAMVMERGVGGVDEEMDVTTECAAEALMRLMEDVYIPDLMHEASLSDSSRKDLMGKDVEWDDQ